MLLVYLSIGIYAIALLSENRPLVPIIIADFMMLAYARAESYDMVSTATILFFTAVHLICFYLTESESASLHNEFLDYED